MKNKVSPIQRMVNILQRALDECYEPETDQDFRSLISDCEEYLCDYAGEGSIETDYEEQVHLTNRGTHLSWNDGMGYQYEADGEFCPEEYLVDSLGKIVKLSISNL